MRLGATHQELIADSLVHATSDGRWFGTEHDASLKTLLEQMDSSGVHRACLSGAPGCENPWDVLEMATEDSRLEPVPCLDPRAALTDPQIAAKLSAVRAVKLHPRFNDHTLDDDSVPALLSLYAAWNSRPRVFVCSLLFGRRPLNQDPVTALHALAASHPEVQFLFLHAAGFDFINLLQAVYSLPNVYVDFSYTLREALSAGMLPQLQFALRRYGQRVVWGSDYPEVSINESLGLASRVVEGLPEDIAERFLGRNLAAFMSWGADELG